MPDMAELLECIASSIDWNPTCLPGKERVTIVDQILRGAHDELRAALVKRDKAIEEAKALRADLADARGRINRLQAELERHEQPVNGGSHA